MHHAALRRGVDAGGHGSGAHAVSLAVRNPMFFKFLVGQAVEYTPIGEKKAGLYKVIRQMPKEEQSADFKYRIKSEAEAYERSVLECQLSPDVGAESEYTMTEPRLPQGSPAT